MDKIIYLAVAGSGKTYSLCNSTSQDKRNLIIAFTHQNLNNIRTELIKRYKFIPKNTDIMTFDSFIFNDFIRPYEYIIWNKYTDKERIRTKGVTFKAPPESTYPKVNPYYIKDSEIGHYIDLLTNRYYCNRMSKLVIKCGVSGILKKGIERLENFYDCIFVDEFQDFRRYDYKILKEIIKRIRISCYLFGDFFQHSVSGMNNSGEPFEGKSYEEFIDNLRKDNIEINTTSLVKSRRCPENICKIIRNHLGIDIYSNEENTGEIKIIRDHKYITRILKNNEIVKLFYKDSKKQNCNGINWGYSKGDTYSETCIIMPKKFDMSDINRNKLYVALTRSKGNVYIIDKDDYDKCI